jgi:hypothetical protein
MIRTLFRAFSSPRWWGLFALAGLFFLLFGLVSYNLFAILKANIDLFLDYGLMVAKDGALEQLLQLVGLGYLSMLFWTLFKTCETLIVRDLTQARDSDLEI